MYEYIYVYICIYIYIYIYIYAVKRNRITNLRTTPCCVTVVLMIYSYTLLVPLNQLLLNKSCMEWYQ